MSATLVPLDSVAARSVRRAGAKAAMLARLRARGLPVPDGVVLPAGVAWRAVPASARDALARTVARWGRCMVRTSARHEDGARDAMAGAYLSRPASAGELESAVAEVRAHAARHAAVPEREVAVLFQRLVDGPGGVFLSRDPLGGAGPVAELSLSGPVPVTAGAPAAYGPATESLRRAALALGRRVEAALGRAVDVELVVADGRAHLVQARPQTALPPRPARSLWSHHGFSQYFPHPLPPLAGTLWCAVFRRAWGIPLRFRDGRIFTIPDCEAPVATSPLAAPAAAVAHWERVLRPRWMRLARRVTARVVSAGDAWETWKWCHARWSAFMQEYFHSPLAPWIERARSWAEAHPERAGSCPLTHRRVRALERTRQLVQRDPALRAAARRGDAGPILADRGPAGRAFAAYLGRFGHYSEAPDDFSRPYPAQDPDLVARALGGERPIRLDRAAAGEGGRWSRLVEIMEEDNDPKYRMACALGRATRALGEELHARGALRSAAEVWSVPARELPALVRAARAGARVRARRAGRAIRSARLRATARVAWWGVPLSRGTVDGVAWRAADPRPDARDLVLVCTALPQGALAFEDGVVAAVCELGGVASHAAIVARQMGLPAVASAEAARHLITGEMIRVDGRAGTVRRIAGT